MILKRHVNLHHRPLQEHNGPMAGGQYWADQSSWDLSDCHLETESDEYLTAGGRIFYQEVRNISGWNELLVGQELLRRTYERVDFCPCGCGNVEGTYVVPEPIEFYLVGVKPSRNLERKALNGYNSRRWKPIRWRPSRSPFEV